MTPDEMAELRAALAAGGHGAVVDALVELKALVHDLIAGHAQQIAAAEQDVAAVEEAVPAVEQATAPPAAGS